MQYSIFWELMLYEFKLDPNVAEATENICCAKDEGKFDHSNQMVEEILLGLQKPQ